MSVRPSLFIPVEMKNSVRRCLFERPTADKKEEDFRKMESQLFFDNARRAKEFSEKWGFDPITENIVSGAEYECYSIDFTKESIPQFYTKVYARRKMMRPVQPYNRRLSSVAQRLDFDSPNRAFKRKLSCENEDICDENKEINFNDCSKKRVPEHGDIVISSSSESRNTSNSSSPSNSPISMSTMSSCLIHNSHFKRITPQSMDISQSSTDLCTPQQRPRNLTQKTIKDYLPCKKPRCATKILPRN